MARNRHRTSKPKDRLSYDQLLDLDLKAFFEDAIRERNLYALLDSFGSACTSRSASLREQVNTYLPPMVEPLIVDESQFYEDAAERIASVRSDLQASWKDRDPSSAYGDIATTWKRMTQAASVYLRKLAATINDPAATPEEKQKAGRLLQKEAEDLTWVDRETGKLSVEMADMFRNATANFNDPATPEDDRRGLAASILDFVHK